MYYLTKYTSGNIYIERAILNDPNDSVETIQLIKCVNPRSLNGVGQQHYLHPSNTSIIIFASEDLETILEQASIEVL